MRMGELTGQSLAKAGLGGDARNSEVLDGVTVDDPNLKMRQQFNIPSSLEGALVTKVEPNSAAARVGLAPGDVILEINRQRVTSADEAGGGVNAGWYEMKKPDEAANPIRQIERVFRTSTQVLRAPTQQQSAETRASVENIDAGSGTEETSLLATWKPMA